MAGKERALYMMPETTFGVDPDADGSDYNWIPTIMGPDGLSELEDRKKPLETMYNTGRPWNTAPIEGRDGWSFRCRIPCIGLATAAGDGSTPAADDWYDDFLTHIFGTQVVDDGEAVGSTTTTGTLVMATAILAEQDLVPVYQTAIPANGVRTQWVLVTDSAGAPSYVITPSFASAPGSAAVGYGRKTYRFSAGQRSLAFVYFEESREYTLLGGGVTAASLVAEAGQPIYWELTFEGNTKTATTKRSSSLPQPGPGPAITPIVAHLSPVWFAGSSSGLSTPSVQIDLGLSYSLRDGTSGTQGRTDFDVLIMDPRVTITPLGSTTIEDWQRNATTGRLLVQLGAGRLSGGVLNTCAFHLENMTPRERTVTIENQRVRHNIVFGASDLVDFEDVAAGAIPVQFVRA